MIWISFLFIQQLFALDVKYTENLIRVTNNTKKESKVILPIKGQLSTEKILKDTCSLKKISIGTSCDIVLNQKNTRKIFIEEYDPFLEIKENKQDFNYSFNFNDLGVGDFIPLKIQLPNDLSCENYNLKIKKKNKYLNIKNLRIENCSVLMDISINAELVYEFYVTIESTHSIVLKLTGNTILRKLKDIEIITPKSSFIKNDKIEVFSIFSIGIPQKIKLNEEEYITKTEKSVQVTHKGFNKNLNKKIIKNNFEDFTVTKNITLHGNHFYFKDINVLKDKILTIKATEESFIYLHAQSIVNNGKIVVESKNLSTIYNEPIITGTMSGKSQKLPLNKNILIIQSHKLDGDGTIASFNDKCLDSEILIYSDSFPKYNFENCTNHSLISFYPEYSKITVDQQESGLIYILLILLVVFSVGIRFAILIIFKKVFK